MIHGDASTFLNALGAREGDPRLTQAVSAVGGEYAVEVYDDDGVVEKYLIMADRGADFLLEDGELETVFIYAAATKTRGMYDGWATLIDGVGPDASPDEVVRALGAPLRSTRAYLTYEADPGFVQFEFDGEKLTMAVVMRRVIGGQTPVEESAESEEPGTVDGEAATFMRAVGTAMFSAEHMAVIELAGPAIETRDDIRDGVAWQYDHFPNTGVTLQFKGEDLVGVLIRLRSDDGESTYPTPDLLIAGLPLPSSREAVTDRFGAPNLSSEQMDLYLVDDRYLRFEYEDGQNTALTVVLPGAEV
ncbi:hypothetical protein [Microbacterium abyssi]|uniref:hypothetical protein n=1 Tax=Microbacterium abyssi TaxID=2782166 RepID=UPI001888F807|nr:hypothetical protein [Microbacterium sp. A18JL241]